MSCAELVRGAGLRGAKTLGLNGRLAGASLLDFHHAMHLGRAVGTLQRRQGRTAPVLVGRAEGDACAIVRDGYISGLVMSGIVAVDAGVVESDRFTAALKASASPLSGGVYVSETSDSVGLMMFDGARPVTGQPLKDIADFADQHDFVVAAGGHIDHVDARLFPRAAAVTHTDDTP